MKIQVFTQMQCLNCQAIYIGQTGDFDIRINKHKKAMDTKASIF